MSQDVIIRVIRQADGESKRGTMRAATTRRLTRTSSRSQNPTTRSMPTPSPRHCVEPTMIHPASLESLRSTAASLASSPPTSTNPQPTHRNNLRDLGKLRAYIDVLVVHRSCWRQGVGRALMEAAEGWARGRGAAAIKTDTNLQSPVSVPFYESLGYERQAVIFRKSLP